MGYYIIAVGGTGNKILESVVYGACADAFYTLGAQKRHIPLPQIHLLSVDVDVACGNTTRAKQAADYYEQVRRMFPADAPAKRGFHTRLQASSWNMNFAKRATSVEQMVQNHKQDQILANILFDSREASLEYNEGFRGHPHLGVLFFASILNELSDEETGQPDEMVRLIHQMKDEMNRGETVKVILCGSIFGGTGASGIPSISQYLRSYFARYSSLFELGSVLMLPYYKVPASTQNEELEIVVKSETFIDKARTALQYYGMEGMIRESETDPKGTFDAVYLLGLPPEAFITTRIYSTGSQSQENDAHMMEWLAMRCIARFFRTGFRGEDSQNIDCYYYQLHDRTFAWESFDEEADLYRLGFGGMLKASAVFFAECYPTLRTLTTGGWKARPRIVNYCAAWFHRAHKLSGVEKTRLEKDLESLYYCLAFFCNWMIQVIRTLPPTLRKVQEVEEWAAEAADNYEQLLKRHVLLQEREALEEREPLPAQQEARQVLREEYNRMLIRQRELLGKLGGSRWLEMLRNAQLDQREAIARQEETIQDLIKRIAFWEGEDSHLIEERILHQERERLSTLRRVAVSLQAKAKKVEEDIEAAIRENIISSQGVDTLEQYDTLPENGLFHPGLLAALHELLTLYGMPSQERDVRRMEVLAETLQRGITRLMIHRQPDYVDMPRIIAGVAGGDCQRKDPEAMLSGFWAALLAASMEEGNT
ncbi:MAG: hypothetical protein GXY67_09165 [Clostridiales bacterium]|nr:hypothetical protein [Clostridiales bacterium]